MTSNSSDTTEEPRYKPTGISLSPQARRLGFSVPTHATLTVWHSLCAWRGPKHKSNTDKRIWALLKSLRDGMAKKMSSQEEGFLMFRFRHFAFENNRPQAKKMRQVEVAARLFRTRDDDIWMLIFDPTNDDMHTVFGEDDAAA